MSIKRALKVFLNFILSGYEIYKIFYINESPLITEIENNKLKFTEIHGEPTHLLNNYLYNKNIAYLGEGSRAFVCLENDNVIGFCVYWHGERYLKRNFFPLGDKEAKLVHIETLQNMRGKGVASNLIRYSSGEMFEHGFKSLYARIWHSNTPSIKSFNNAGWKYLTTIVTARSKLFGSIKIRLKPFKIMKRD